jgi:hypothetical protein
VTGVVKSLYIIQAGPAPGTRAKKLYWNQPPSRGPLIDVTAVPKLTFYYNEDIPAPTNVVSPETVWVAPSGSKQHLYARTGMGYLVLLYEGAVTNGPLYGVDVVQVLPNVGWYEQTVPVGAQLLPVLPVSNAAPPFISAGDDSTPMLIYQHGVQGKMNGAVFAVNQNTLTPLMEVFFQEIGGYGFNVNWPYEMDRYSSYWPEENDRRKPARLCVRGDSDDDIGPPFNIPTALNPELMDAEQYANASDHGFLNTNAFSSSGPGKSLLKCSTDNGNGQPGSEWVGFEVIKSVERNMLLWQYRRVLRLQPPTPVANYQLRLVLSGTFNYAHCNADGSDLRFYDAGGEELDYWIEQWNNAGVSIVWIEASNPQTATIYFEYGNTNTYPLSSAWDTFDLYDDFTEGFDQWNVLGAPVAQNGQLLLHPGDQLVARALVQPGSIIETWLAGALTPQVNMRGALCGASSLYGLGSFFIADLNNLLSNPVQYADWDLGRNGNLAFFGQACDGKYVQYGPSLASLASNDLLAVAIENGRVTWFRNNVQQGSPVVQNTPSPLLFPLLNVYTSASGTQTVRISRVRMRKYSATPPTITIGAEQPALTIDWPIGVELSDDHQEGPGSGYLHVSQGNRYLPDFYSYGSSNSQLFGVNAGTLEVWWCSWILTNRYAAGIQIPSFVRRYNNIWPGMGTNSALAYTTLGSSVNCGTDPALGPTNQLTLEAWVWPRAKNTLNAVIAKRTADSGTSDGYALYINSRDTSDGCLVFETKDQTFSTPAGAIATGIWQHLAVTVAGTNVTLYINGSAAQAAGGVNLTRDNAAPLLLGACGGADAGFLGYLDELRVWATARSAAQIAQDAQQELPNPQDQSGLLAYYPCNEGSGTTVADVSGYGYAGTLNTVTWSGTAAPITGSSGNLGQIVVASSLGGRPFDGAWQNAYIYAQNNAGQPGYNPNEEHALMYSGLPYALRNDLNRQNTNSAYTSQPFVLMPYLPPNSARWRVQVYQVLATNAQYAFVYPTNYAARLLSPPDPLASWPGNQQTIIFTGPAWRDRNNHLWAAAAGDGGPNSQASIVLQWFYPNMDSSWYIPAWYASSLSNGVIPLLDRFAGTPGRPINTFYTISWEQNYPQLQVYDTLYKPRHGLPDISQQTSADIIYQQAMVNNAFGTGPVVRLVDPTRVRSVALPANYALPANMVKETSFVQGHYYFNDLPPQLNQRLWYDATQKKLLLNGQYVPLTSSQIGLPGYLLFNVISPREKVTITNVFGAYGDATLFNAALALCNLCSNVIEVTNDAIPFDTLALSAGTAKGTGYVTVAFNNSTNTMMQPPSDQIQLQVINVVLPAFDGELEQVGLESNPYAQQSTVRYSSDFSGDPSPFAFDWRFVLPDNNGLIPANQTNVEQWSKYPYISPASGQGAVDITIAGDNLFALDSHYFVARYRRTQLGYPGGTNWSAWTPPAYVEGWVQRVLDAITPFEQRYYDYYNRQINTLVTMISQIGTRYEGNVPLDPRSIDQWGLLEIYMTLLKSAMDMSISGNPPHHDDNANQMIMLAAGRIADLYILLGNEAYADAQDPTIAISTDDDVYGYAAPSLFCFMNQTASLLDETLALLRGRGQGSPARQEIPPVEPPVWTTPYYNRLPWNFTKDITGGEVAYALNYDILDENGNADGIINEQDAAILYPQGHGDAWGHYLSAITLYYMLINNPFFDWIPGTYVENVGSVPVSVNYRHEQRFCQIAAAKARTGAEIVRDTYRQAYGDNPRSQWQGYYDSDTNRAWGVGEWGVRAGMGAYFDWAVGNAVLPAYSPFTGIQRIDRTNVSELALIANSLMDVQRTVDQADRGLNPLGLAANVVPFDIDPSLLYEPDWVPDTTLSHFEQIYTRAVAALQNAGKVFDYAQNTSQALRKQADTQNAFQRTVRDQERDFTSRLNELYGLPYPDDIGPAGTYPSGYFGPDLYHWMYLDNTYLASQPQQTYDVILTGVVYNVNKKGERSTTNIVLTYHVDADSQMAVKPSTWTTPRPAMGEIQQAYGAYLQVFGSLEAKLHDYNNKISEIEQTSAMIHNKYKLQDDHLKVLNGQYAEVATMNSLILVAKAISFTFESIVLASKGGEEAVNKGTPLVFVAGLAAGVDPSFLPRLASTSIHWALRVAYAVSTGLKEMLVTAQEFAKQLIEIHVAVDQYDTESQIAMLEDVNELQNKIRELGTLMLDMHTLEQSLNQTYGAYTEKVQQGNQLQSDRARFRQETAADVQAYRYKDMAFRIFRNDALQKYRAQFEVAARYAYLAVKAYDYETALRPGDARGPGSAYLDNIVRSMAIGILDDDGNPQTGPLSGDGGLADTLARIKLNWDTVLQGQLGFNNPQQETSRFSLRAEFFRCLPETRRGARINTLSLTGMHWRTVLSNCVVANILELPEFQRFCIPFDPAIAPEPGIVIEFGTTIQQGKNFFGLDLAGGDNAYDSSHFATKIRTVGIWFSNYDLSELANNPRVYLIPVGNDILRSPGGDSTYLREFTILDQALPVPLPILPTDLAHDDWIPLFDTFSEQYAAIRRFAALRAFNDAGDFTPDDATYSTRLIGRSVWNSRWLLIIPGSTLHADKYRGIQNFLDSVTDIKIFFETYSYSGN